MSESALVLEATMIESYDRLSLVHRTLADLVSGEGIDHATATMLGGCELVLADVLEDLDEVLERD